MSQPPYSIYLKHQANSLRIYPALAKEIGLNESAVLLQIDFWIETSSTPHHEGKRWTFQSINNMRDKAFPFWSRDTINRAVNKLLKMDLLIEGQFNKKSYDKTRWFAINYEQLKKLESVIVIDNREGKGVSDRVSENRTGEMQNRTGEMQNRTTIPDITTDSTTDNTTSTGSPDGHAKDQSNPAQYPSEANQQQVQEVQKVQQRVQDPLENPPGPSIPEKQEDSASWEDVKQGLAVDPDPNHGPARENGVQSLRKQIQEQAARRVSATQMRKLRELERQADSKAFREKLPGYVKVAEEARAQLEQSLRADPVWAYSQEILFALRDTNRRVYNRCAATCEQMKQNLKDKIQIMLDENIPARAYIAWALRTLGPEQLSRGIHYLLSEGVVGKYIETEMGGILSEQEVQPPDNWGSMTPRERTDWLAAKGLSG